MKTKSPLKDLTLIQIILRFDTDEKARKHLEAVLWKGGMPRVSAAETTALTLVTRKALENGMHRKRIAGEFQKSVEKFSRL